MISSSDKDAIIRILVRRIEDLESRLRDSQEESMRYEFSSSAHHDVSKLKVLFEVYNAVAGINHDDVNETDLIKELLATGKFSEDEAKEYIMKAMQNGQIYERKSGFYSRT